jgi:arylsulfatase A-like enzyme
MSTSYGCRSYSRRDVLRLGAVGLSALTLPAILRAERQAAARPAKAKNVIFIWQQGGPPHQDMWDMKPDAPEEIRGEFKPIATDLPGYQVCELMPQLARRIHKLTVLRGVNHHIPDHNPASMFMLGSGNAPSSAHKYPTWSSVAKKELPEVRGVPTAVAIPVEPAEGPGAGFLGSAYQSFAIQSDPSDSDFKARSMVLPPGIDPARFERRQALLRDTAPSFDQLAERPDLLRSLDKFYQDAHDIILSPRTRDAFRIDQEPDRLRDRYGRGKLGQRLLLARRLIQAGVRFVTINEPVGWDTHQDNFNRLRQNLPVVDQAVSALLDDLSERGMLADTLVMMFGEFGRTPKINDKSGRDHWAQAMSIMLAGGGVPAGLIYGTTDRNGAFVTDKSHSPADFACTVYTLLGIDPHTIYPTPAGQPVPLVNGGQPIAALL